MNHKDKRILKLWLAGIRNKDTIAKKLGYQPLGGFASGVKRVTEGLERLRADGRIPDDVHIFDQCPKPYKHRKPTE